MSTRREIFDTPTANPDGTVNLRGVTLPTRRVKKGFDIVECTGCWRIWIQPKLRGKNRAPLSCGRCAGRPAIIVHTKSEDE